MLPARRHEDRSRGSREVTLLTVQFCGARMQNLLDESEDFPYT